MIKQIFSKYKFPALMSFVLAIVIIALKLESSPLNIALIILGSFLGVFILDLDYIFYTFLVDPKHYFSKNVSDFLRSKKFGSAFVYIQHHKKELRHMPLHSALFQTCLIILCFYTLISTQSIFGKTLILSTLIQSFFEQAEDYAEDKNLNNWFWVLKVKPTKNFLIGYFSTLFVGFLYLLSLI
ncbi:hypothetical protein COV27_02965 [candidate division WWE3 bacterium CG10_big_fil_rev_8_21_14_0_10_39_14]|nr:MAG: hypothetical protein COV27_02965 [candidate division WWE3 bacterium CG10_big_fil_rev_8_21_14_0_10_39_14]